MSKEFTLIFMFSKNLDNVLLLERKKPPFVGLLNGLGGKKESGETWSQCAIRELYEESGLMEAVDYKNLEFLMEIGPPQFTMHVFAGVLSTDWPHKEMVLSEGTLRMYDAKSIAEENETVLAENVGMYIKTALSVFA